MENPIEVVNPLSVPRTQLSKLAARRYDDRAGRRVGLLENNKPNADLFFQFIGEMLQARYLDLTLVPKRKMTRLESGGLVELAESINPFTD